LQFTPLYSEHLALKPSDNALYGDSYISCRKRKFRSRDFSVLVVSVSIHFGQTVKSYNV